MLTIHPANRTPEWIEDNSLTSEPLRWFTVGDATFWIHKGSNGSSGIGFNVYDDDGTYIDCFDTLMELRAVVEKWS